MNGNHLLIVPSEIARLASELLQFQWFLDNESVKDCCDLISLSPSDDLTYLLETLKEQLKATDALLLEISEPDLFVQVETVRKLVDLLKHDEQTLKKLQMSLIKHHSTRQAKNDAVALGQDYRYFRKTLRQWLNHDKLDSPGDPATVNNQQLNPIGEV